MKRHICTALIFVLVIAALTGCEKMGQPIPVGSCSRVEIRGLQVSPSAKALAIGSSGFIYTLSEFGGRLYVDIYQPVSPTNTGSYEVPVKRVRGGWLADCSKVSIVEHEEHDNYLEPVIGTIR